MDGTWKSMSFKCQSRPSSQHAKVTLMSRHTIHFLTHNQPLSGCAPLQYTCWLQFQLISGVNFFQRKTGSPFAQQFGGLCVQESLSSLCIVMFTLVWIYVYDVRENTPIFCNRKIYVFHDSFIFILCKQTKNLKFFLLIWFLFLSLMNSLTWFLFALFKGFPVPSLFRAV